MSRGSNNGGGGLSRPSGIAKAGFNSLQSKPSGGNLYGGGSGIGMNGPPELPDKNKFGGGGLGKFSGGGLGGYGRKGGL